MMDFSDEPDTEVVDVVELAAGHADAGAYLDGSLNPEAEVAYRDHLGGCKPCQVDLHGEVQLRAFELGPVPPRPRRPGLSAEYQARIAAAARARRGGQ